MIEKFEIEKDNDNLRWFCNKTAILRAVSNLDQAMVDESRQLVFVLSGPQELPTELKILDEAGMEVFSCSPPQGSDFYYLTKTPARNVLIICVFDEKPEGWHDWHYSFDL
ncbi:hypothetical protein [Pantoea cypripedii]|uniref:hypothetical protein n=1 Tax=Pantoea cypripedii TaxID=55209 RepID=UPI00111C4EA2|nr:hypothetical protein [Pantoea cypripedii]